MERNEITIRVSQSTTGSWSLTASLSAPHRGGRGIRMIPMRSVTRSLRHPYVEGLTEGLLMEWINALTLVAAGFYETPALPFDLG
jgi:hypothetical protein